MVRGGFETNWCARAGCAISWLSMTELGVDVLVRSDSIEASTFGYEASAGLAVASADLDDGSDGSVAVVVVLVAVVVDGASISPGATVTLHSSLVLPSKQHTD